MKLSLGKRHQSGFTLSELMIALALGTFLVGGVIGVYIANVRTGEVNSVVSQVQQASQISFQLLSRDVQNAGFTGCANTLPSRVVNALNNPGVWWASWTGGIQGYESTATVVPTFGAGIAPVANTDAVELMYGRGFSASVVGHNVVAVPPLVINTNTVGIVANDIVVGCDSRMAVIFQVTAIAGTSLSHAVGAGTPGNATLNFGFGVNGVNFQQSLASDAGTIIPMESVAWYVGSSGGIQSLYRVAMVAGVLRTEEILQGVENLQLQYLVAGAANYVNANLVPDADGDGVLDWENVVAVRATLTLANTYAVPMADGMRTISHVINLRNH